MTSSERPESIAGDAAAQTVTVTALLFARNNEAHVARALTSVLTQQYPAEKLDVVVIDGGSQDRTVDAVQAIAAEYPGRVQLLSQPRSDKGAGLEQALGAATGELIALLDGDDVWLPSKTAKQVELIEGTPGVTAALCEATVIDAGGQPTARTVGRTLQAMRDLACGVRPSILMLALMSDITTRSSLIMRADLLSLIPDGITLLDWWMALCAAEAGEIEFIPEVLVGNRVRVRPPGAGRPGLDAHEAIAGEWRLRRWALANLDLSGLAAQQMAQVWQQALRSANHNPQVHEATGPLQASDLHRASEAQRQADGCRAAGDLTAEAALRLRALAAAPNDNAANTAFLDAVTRVTAAERIAHPLEGARELVLLADAEDLLSQPQMLSEYAQQLAGVYSLTLAIDASRLPPGQAQISLPDLVARCGLSERDDVDLLGVVMELDVVQRRRMISGAIGVYRPTDDAHGQASAGANEHPGGGDTELPVFTPQSLRQLRAQVASGVSGARVEVAELPTVTAVMPAYNYAHFIERSIESAMSQQYPPQLLDLVVVDDGSRDDTAQVALAAAERYPGRVKVISQANAGATAALDRARTEAQGQLIGLLDADDVWLPEKTMRQVQRMRLRPELGLVFSDLQTVDAGESMLEPSIYGIPGDPNLTRPFARVLRSNCAINSSILLTRELFEPLPDNASYADWWLTLHAARVSKIDLIREPLVLYRMHDGNLTHGVTGERRVREGRKQVEFMLWVFRHMDLSRLAVREIQEVWGGLEAFARQAHLAAGTMMVTLTTVTDAGRAKARELTLEADAARDEGQLGSEAILRLRARAWACDEMQLVEAMNDAVARAVSAGA